MCVEKHKGILDRDSGFILGLKCPCGSDGVSSEVLDNVGILSHPREQGRVSQLSERARHTPVTSSVGSALSRADLCSSGRSPGACS